jgi:hypothetical protein
MNKIKLLAGTVAVVCLLAGMGGGSLYAQQPATTPSELVMAYDQLADTILAAKKTEWHMVQSILATTYNHAQGTFATAQRKLGAGKDVRADLEKLADLVSQLGNEGDAAVAAIRKRLVEGGHHHNVKGEEQGIYDEGFVIVTRKAKKAFLDAAGNIGRMASSPDGDKLEQEWKAVAKQYRDLW